MQMCVFVCSCPRQAQGKMMVTSLFVHHIDLAEQRVILYHAGSESCLFETFQEVHPVRLKIEALLADRASTE